MKPTPTQPHTRLQALCATTADLQRGGRSDQQHVLCCSLHEAPRHHGRDLLVDVEVSDVAVVNALTQEEEEEEEEHQEDKGTSRQGDRRTRGHEDKRCSGEMSGD